MKIKLFNFLAFAFTLTQLAIAGPLAYAICQAGCSAVVVACYSAGGAIFGTVAAVAAPAAILACNSAFGTCQAACAVAFLLPTP